MMANENMIESFFRDMQRNAECTFTFDVTEGIVLEDISNSKEQNISRAYGFTSPFSFDEFLRVCVQRGTHAEFTIGASLRKKLLRKYANNIPVFETIFSVTKSETCFYKATYLLCCLYEEGHVYATVFVRRQSRDNSEFSRYLLGTEDEEKKTRELQEQQAEIVNALSKDYANIYLVKPTRNLMKTIKLNGYIIEGIQNQTSEWFPYYTFVRKYAQDRVIEEDRDVLVQKLSPEGILKALKDKNEFAYSYRVLDKGEIHYYQAKYITMEEKGLVIAAFQNVDETALMEKHQKEELQNALNEAEKASKAKTSFLFNMSHDIRTPMSAIIGFTDLIEKHLEDTEKVKEYLKKMRSSSSYLLSLINDILEMARIENGKEMLDEVDVDAREVTRAVIAAFETEFPKKNITFEYSVHIEHSHVFCDVVKVKEIIFNILSNAYKYTPSGGKVLYSVQEIQLHDPDIAVFKTVISDTGIGMSREFLQHIFEDFSRERTSTESRQTGTGLGMAIAYHLVQLMHGNISVQSEEGKGSTFTVLLPHHIVKDVSDVKEEETPVDVSLLSGQHVLLAEDNELNAEILITLLQDEGIHVEWAKDGVECLGKLEEQKPGYYLTVFMDIQMPVMNGYKATSLIRNLKEEGYANVPIYAMTANAFEEDKQKALEMGMNGHIAKPVKLSVLNKVLAKELMKKQSASE